MQHLFSGKYFAVAVILAAGTPAFAHVFLDHADPKVGSDSPTVPTKVQLWFDGEVEPPDSIVQVFDDAGKQIDKKDCTIDAKDGSLMVVSLPDKLPPGTYKVVWTAVSSDSHVTHGDFKFTVKSP